MALSVLALLLAQPAAGACRLPDRLPRAHVGYDEAINRDASVDGYVLALSWSPEYCAGAGDNPKARIQCRDNRFRFVVHGLWPQNAQARGADGQPRGCRVGQAVAEPTLRRNLCLLPGVQLIQDQWEKHGSCAFPTPESYFARTAALYGALKLPPLPVGRMTVASMKQAFVSANPGLPAQALAVRVGRGRPHFREILVCYDRAYRFTRCTAGGTPDRVEMILRAPGGANRQEPVTRSGG